MKRVFFLATYLVLAACLVVAPVTGCATSGDKETLDPRDTRGAADSDSVASEAEAAGGRITERTAVAAPGERRVPERTDAGAGTPRREASQRLVEEGKGYWTAGRNQEARARFDRALQLDGSNGAAHFYLAQVSADEGRWADAAGYSEQAEALLAGREDWRQPLLDLASRIDERR